MTDIFIHHAQEYAQLIRRQDYQGNILPTLRNIRPLEGTDVVEFGAGTGRFTCMLAPMVNSIRAFDSLPQMLEIARRELEKLPVSNWEIGQADNRSIPAESASADIALAGWTLALFMLTDDWKANITQALNEMRRVLRPGGTGIILEPLGTVSEPPRAPAMELLNTLYQHFEHELGFSSKEIRTDFQFESEAEAQPLVRLFFGDHVADRLQRERQRIHLTEATVVWWFHV